MKPAEGFTFEYGPDLKKISDLICTTWGKPCWNYDEGLLALHIKRPSGDRELNVAQISEDGTVASFQAYMPFDISYYNKAYKAVFASFLTVSADFQGRGLGGPQQGVLIEKAIEKGYDLYVTMCEVGAVSNYAVEKVFKKMNLPVKVVNVCRYIAALNELVQPILPQKTSGNTCIAIAQDVENIKPLVKNIGTNTELYKIIPDEDMQFLFVDRPHSRTYLYEKNNQVKGFINLLLLEVLESDTEKKLNVYFDNVSFEKMSDDEIEEFIGDVMLDLQRDKFHTAFMPNIGYIDTSVFKKYRFRMVPRELNLYIAPLKEGVLPDGIEEVSTFYLDVY